MISDLLPRRLKLKIRSLINSRYQKIWENNFITALRNDRIEQEKRIPKYDLQKKHIYNMTVLLDRNELLKNLPSNAVCAEIGVNEGEFSEQILSITLPQKLHLIDAWGNAERYHDGLKLHVQNKFKREIAEGKMEINVGLSTVVLKQMPDHYFDWVYLDTDHSYQVTYDELMILKDKVKPKGMICGHDYIIGNWMGNVRYGVIEAVHELCVKDNWELIYTTINKNEMPSFAIKKIGE